ncbi:hypothetical protein CHLNCDRAFT_144182 [Chlorella variabilis]|uniref:EGF-like domain-containing protein n=1 Tax=Chlorella variabilis TaxID=554065 RepID=E1ZC37_CHLVA|nr:hypothetical protein CHLNCDRAFT_144182 [Chlorella variabilis]EFN56745.1 hypothetical protein CHLNCDRAFT_144182 [Chlorella variabilis]|eukprot:XP_005848847.1 hypothetical protein CHLNCDRAFT_144182 [Chlorella variabilis]
MPPLLLFAALLLAASGSAAAAGCLVERANCIACSYGARKCGQCIYGWSPNARGTCVRCPPNCASCDTSRSCTNCARTYRLNRRGDCVKCKVPHCSWCYDNATSCSYCQQGYATNYRTGGTCKACAKKNCLWCVYAEDLGNAQFCTGCRYGYMATWPAGVNTDPRIGGCDCKQRCPIKFCAPGKCFKNGPPDTGTVNCDSCLDGFTDLQACLKCTDPGCLSCWDPHTCKACRPGWVLVDNNRCIRVLPP